MKVQMRDAAEEQRLHSAAQILGVNIQTVLEVAAAKMLKNLELIIEEPRILQGWDVLLAAIRADLIHSAPAAVRPDDSLEASSREQLADALFEGADLGRNSIIGRARARVLCGLLIELWAEDRRAPAVGYGSAEFSDRTPSLPLSSASAVRTQPRTSCSVSKTSSGRQNPPSRMADSGGDPRRSRSSPPAPSGHPPS